MHVLRFLMVAPLIDQPKARQSQRTPTPPAAGRIERRRFCKRFALRITE
jgi:hypothetical protein